MSQRQRVSLFFSVCLAFSSHVFAQTQNAVPKYSGGTLVDSTIYEVSGKVGIGTSAPATRVDVVHPGADGIKTKSTSSTGYTSLILVNDVGTDSSLYTTGSAHSSYRLGATTAATTFLESNATNGLALFTFNSAAVRLGTANTERVRISESGNVGIGTATPSTRLHVEHSGADGIKTKTTTASGYTSLVLASDGGESTLYTTGSAHASSRLGASTAATTFLESQATNGLGLFTFNAAALRLGTNNAERLRIDPSGNIGIGITNPTAKLHVIGDVITTGNLVVGGNLTARFQDVAEWVDAAEALEPGTVVIVDADGDNRVVAATESYDTRVAGAVSPQPGLILGEAGEGKSLIAQSGRVRVKVDATYGAISRGDLLVSSPTKGHAMRSQPVEMGGRRVHLPGTLVGKALEALTEGRGEILVLLTLQ